MACGVLIYKGTYNLGDAIQTAALSRLLPAPLAGIYRDEAATECHPDGRADVFVVNGWLGDATPASSPNCLFAGIHVGRRHAEQINWLSHSNYTAGSRDPYTQSYLESRGIGSEMIGCATLTLDRYHGPRTGRYAVDSRQPDCVALTNHLEYGTRWTRQWDAALERLAALRTAEIVYTSRLHVVLPCLAFGTPVVMKRAEIEAVVQPERFSLLETLAFRYDEVFVTDVTPWRERYIRFIAGQMGRELPPPGEYQMPVPMSPDRS